MSMGTGGNGGQPQAPAQAPTASNQPQMNILAQYIKDFSFENPNAPRSLAPSQVSPSINIQVSVNANPMSDTEVEVVLKIEGKAEVQNTVLFSFELLYAGLFRIQNVPQENLHPLIMIECPRLLFPYAREIISVTVSNGGFPPLLLDPVDFVGLYRANMEKAQAGAASPPAAPVQA